MAILSGSKRLQAAIPLTVNSAIPTAALRIDSSDLGGARVPYDCAAACPQKDLIQRRPIAENQCFSP
jgi:hypothetical protein